MATHTHSHAHTQTAHRATSLLGKTANYCEFLFSQNWGSQTHTALKSLKTAENEGQRPHICISTPHSPPRGRAVSHLIFCSCLSSMASVCKNISFWGVVCLLGITQPTLKELMGNGGLGSPCSQSRVYRTARWFMDFAVCIRTSQTAGAGIGHRGRLELRGFWFTSQFLLASRV